MKISQRGVNLKISADYTNYSDLLESSVVKISDDVTLTITPTEKDVPVNGETVKEYSVQFKYEDTLKVYDNTYEYTRQELKQFIKLLQDIQNQIQQEASKVVNGAGSGSCSR